MHRLPRTCETRQAVGDLAGIHLEILLIGIALGFSKGSTTMIGLPSASVDDAQHGPDRKRMRTGVFVTTALNRDDHVGSTALRSAEMWTAACSPPRPSTADQIRSIDLPMSSLGLSAARSGCRMKAESSTGRWVQVTAALAAWAVFSELQVHPKAPPRTR
jgi:hypothetical protein